MPRTYCQGCRQEIRWADTTSGRHIPLNPRPDHRGNLAYVTTPKGWRVKQFAPTQLSGMAAAERWMPHAATCPRKHPGRPS